MAGRRDLNAEREAERNRRALLRRATLYTVGFFTAGVAVAAVGAALVALLLGVTGLPFLPTWLVLFGVVVAGAGLALLIQNLRERKARSPRH